MTLTSVLSMASFTMIQSRRRLEEYFRLQYYIFVLKTTMFLFWHVSSKRVSSFKKHRLYSIVKPETKILRKNLQF